MARIVVDPVTRIEGHLRVEAVVEGGVIKDAFSAGMMVRGLEKILEGRDPRDAWAVVGRVCGVCTSIHSLASVRAVEDALGVVVPRTAELIRNIMSCTLQVHDHVVHFYHLHALDWVDVPKVLEADPARTAALAQSISPWPKSSAGYFAGVQRRIREFVGSGQLGIFANGYWGHPQMRLPPEVNLLGVAHYLEALEWQKEVVKIHAIFGGKNPHPNYLVGGMPCSIDVDEVNAINTERLNMVGALIADAQRFVEEVYLPDLLAIAGFYKDWGAIGGGLSNYLSYGDLPTRGYAHPEFFKFPRGAILGRDLGTVHPVDAKKPDELLEQTLHSWYAKDEQEAQGRHPSQGRTEIAYSGPRPPFKTLEGSDRYSYLKTPRWKGHAMEVGPLARLLVAHAAGNADVKEVVGEGLKRLGVPLTALFSTLGRTAARGLETRLIARWLGEFHRELLAQVKAHETATFNRERWDPATWPEECEGVGLAEAPRGALAHYVRIKHGKIASYQLVVPTTWNASPRDASGQRSAYEASLIGTPVAHLEQPLELLRTIHSFDPCLSCSVHLYDPEGRQLGEAHSE